MATWLEAEFEKIVAPLIKPEVDAFTTQIKNDEPAIVADIEAFSTKEGGYAAAAAEAIVNRLPSSPVFDLVKPYVSATITTAITALTGTVQGNAQAWFDAAYAKLVSVEASLGL
jgi:hypothetical protein